MDCDSLCNSNGMEPIYTPNGICDPNTLSQQWCATREEEWYDGPNLGYCGEGGTCQCLVQVTNFFDLPQPYTCELRNCLLSASHNICQNNSCVIAQGSGVDECANDVNCQIHNICQGASCVLVNGFGTNDCQTNSDCAGSDILSISVAPNLLSLSSPGDAGSYTVTVTKNSGSGVTGANLGATCPAATGITCSWLSGSTAVFGGGTTANLTYKVNTTGATPQNRYSIPFKALAAGACSGICSPSQTAYLQVGSCTALTYQPYTSGFSLSETGPSGYSLTVTTGQTFYTYVDYGQNGIDSIQAPNSGTNTCTFRAFMSGSNGNSTARYRCTAPASPGSYAYITGTNGNTTSNTCASGPATIGTVTVTGGPHQAQCIGISGAPSTIGINQPFSATITMKNVGSDTWQSDEINPAQPYRLGATDRMDNTIWSPSNRIHMPANSTAPPGTQVAFTGNFTAPATASSSQSFDWQMVQDGPGGAWFNNGTCTTTITVTSPNVAVCDSSWHTLPIGGATPSQPVMMYLPTGANTQFSNGLGVFVIGTDNNGYAATCSFNASDPCIWNGWTWLGSSPSGGFTSSPAGNYDSWNGWYNVIYGSDHLSTYWLGNVSGGWWPGVNNYQPKGNNYPAAYGQPFRVIDASGRYWQIRRNNDNSMSYYCGISATCEDLNFYPATSSVTPGSVTVGTTVTASCDYGVYGISNVSASITGGGTCAFDSTQGVNGWTGTAAMFKCTTLSAGTQTVTCNLSSGGNQNTCGPLNNTAGTVNVTALPNPPDGPPSGCNSQQVCTLSGGTPACGVVRLQWTDMSTNEDSFRLYKSAGSSFPGAPGLFATVTSTTKAATGQTYSYDYSLGSDTAPYYYWVTAYENMGIESNSVTFGSIAAYACTANLGDSDKDIVSVNGKAVAASACNASTDPLPVGTSLNVGDNLGFQINLCNDYGQATTTGITVTDTMVNLQVPAAGWQARYNGSVLSYDGACAATPNPAVNHYCVSGAAPNQTLTFNLSGPADNIAPGVIANVTFTAQLTAPVGTTQTQSRFQNSFNINYNGGLNLPKSTPWLPFYTGKGSPSINEVP